MEVLRNNEKEMLEILNTVIEMKSAFHGAINRPDTAEEIIGVLEERSIEKFQN